MTRKDFVLIAESISNVEARGGDTATLNMVVDEICTSIETEHPRFDRARFEKAAMPLKSEHLKRAILARLNI